MRKPDEGTGPADLVELSAWAACGSNRTPYGQIWSRIGRYERKWCRFWRKKKKVTRVQELVLENNRGEARARFGVDDEDNVVLRFWDAEGNSRLYMGLSAEGTPRIGLHYASGKGSIQLEANDKLKSAALIIVGPSGKAQVLLGIARNGHPAIALYDDSGNQVFPDPAQPDSDRWNDDLDSFDWDDILHQ